VAKFGSAAERGALVEEVLPRLVDLAKNPYGHFLICKLLASATKQTLAGDCPQWHSACACMETFARPLGANGSKCMCSWRRVHRLVEQTGERCVCR